MYDRNVREQFPKNLTRILNEKKMQQKELALAMGVKEATVSQYVLGVNFPRPDNLQSIARILNVPINDLIEKKEETRLIPVFAKVPAGVPIEAIQDVIDYEEITEAMAKEGDFFAVRVSGDSMAPRIMDGDVLIVKKQADAESGDTVIIAVNDDYEATCKTIKKSDDGITLIPRNPAYSPQFFTWRQAKELPVNIIGKVVELRAKTI